MCTMAVFEQGLQTVQEQQRAFAFAQASQTELARTWHLAFVRQQDTTSQSSADLDRLLVKALHTLALDTQQDTLAARLPDMPRQCLDTVVEPKRFLDT